MGMLSKVGRGGARRPPAMCAGQQVYVPQGTRVGLMRFYGGGGGWQAKLAGSAAEASSAPPSPCRCWGGTAQQRHGRHDVPPEHISYPTRRRTPFAKPCQQACTTPSPPPPASPPFHSDVHIIPPACLGPPALAWLGCMWRCGCVAQWEEALQAQSGSYTEAGHSAGKRSGDCRAMAMANKKQQALWKGAAVKTAASLVSVLCVRACVRAFLHACMAACVCAVAAGRPHVPCVHV